MSPVFADTDGHKPVPNLGGGFIGEDVTSPSAGLDLEEDDIVDGSDPLMRGVRGGELLVCLLSLTASDTRSFLVMPRKWAAWEINSSVAGSIFRGV
ncbi:hypothetical protein [Nonomuraea sp. MG754425]|uniref:hypothetical protein n=1 Tax=Nonomuraea sp. MG754425 TaxID=2570319 RepID=UPI001F301165|nr:hypothetical protein [Nonomuraea sp. MG754425]